MLTMSFVYFNIWQIKQTQPDDFAKAIIGFGKDAEKNLLEAPSPFTFSAVNERTILRLLKLIACDNDKIGLQAVIKHMTRRARHLRPARRVGEENSGSLLSYIDFRRHSFQPGVGGCRPTHRSGPQDGI